MTYPAPLYDAVVFDLDGTLAATDRFWPQAAEAGARRGYAELGLERELPTAAEWMGMVGLPLEGAFRGVFADLTQAQRAVLMRCCLEEESRVIRVGGVALIPGVEECLDELRDAGLRLGIASNCGADYLDAMLEGLGLARWIDEPRCLSSPGISTKADMVTDLLSTYATRSAVMVGDRRGDRDAAWANGIPHVHLSRGFAPLGEDFACEATLESLADLPELLHQRRRALAGLASQVGAARRIGIVGGAATGKTLIARDLARVVAPGVEVGEGAEGVDCLVRVVADPEVVERRIRGREGRLSGLRAAQEALDRALAVGADPATADFILDGSDALAPRIRED